MARCRFRHSAARPADYSGKASVAEPLKAYAVGPALRLPQEALGDLRSFNYRAFTVPSGVHIFRPAQQGAFSCCDLTNKPQRPVGSEASPAALQSRGSTPFGSACPVSYGSYSRFSRCWRVLLGSLSRLAQFLHQSYERNELLNPSCQPILEN